MFSNEYTLLMIWVFTHWWQRFDVSKMILFQLSKNNAADIYLDTAILYFLVTHDRVAAASVIMP